MRGNTFDAIKYINTFRVLMIFFSLKSAEKGFQNDAKIIKIRDVLI